MHSLKKTNALPPTWGRVVQEIHSWIAALDPGIHGGVLARLQQASKLLDSGGGVSECVLALDQAWTALSGNERTQNDRRVAARMRLVRAAIESARERAGRTSELRATAEADDETAAEVRSSSIQVKEPRPSSRPQSERPALAIVLDAMEEGLAPPPSKLNTSKRQKLKRAVDTSERARRISETALARPPTWSRATPSRGITRDGAAVPPPPPSTASRTSDRTIPAESGSFTRKQLVPPDLARAPSKVPPQPPPAALKRSTPVAARLNKPTPKPSSAPKTSRNSPLFQIGFHAGEAHKLYVGNEADLAKGGVFVATTHLLPVDDAVELLLDTGTERLFVKGEVRWRNEVENPGLPQGMGVAFGELSKKNLAALEQLATHHHPIFYAD